MLYQLNYIHHVWDCKGTKKNRSLQGVTEKNQSETAGDQDPFRS